LPLVEIAIVADDLTGALDSAAPFAARGAETRVAAIPDLDRLGTPMPAVLSASTTSRHLPPDLAAASVAETCAMLSRLEPGLWFKKIDSTLRGNVAVETLAAMAASGLDHAIVCPAVPAHGRSVEDGVVMVDGVPLPNTDFVHDAVTPASSTPLADQFRALDPSLTVAEIAIPLPAAPSARAVWIVDASNADDLAEIAAWLAKRNGQSLAVGAAGLGEALAEILVGPRSNYPSQRIDGPFLFVIGSRATRTEAQVGRLIAGHAEIRIIDAPGGRFNPAQAIVSAEGQSAIISIPHRTDDPTAEQVARSLGENVAALLERMAFGAVFMTGGDTAAAVLAAIDHPVVALDGEVVPGVPLGHVEFGGKPLRLITKAGGFGEESLLADLVARAGT
jgi:uncharacterized protein YgbK (DUF1537 family)